MSYAEQLSGGHPNSLGNTVAVVDDVLAHPGRLEQLYGCYFADDATVRLRTSNAMKRIAEARPELLLPYLDRLLSEISLIEQASAQWTLAQLLLTYTDELNEKQLATAKGLLQRNLAQSSDWIVLIQTATTLAEWAGEDQELNDWLIPQLLALENDPRKAVSRRATKLLASMLTDYPPTQ